MLKRLNDLNKFPILDLFSEEFKKYGRVIEGYNPSLLLDILENDTNVPNDGNIYIASDLKMEALSIKEELQNNFYGGMEIEVGYCNGNNSTLNGLEYHKGSEIDIPSTDMVLLLGNVWDIKNNTYDSSLVEAFFIPKGMMVELYGTTLHFAPCKLSKDGFKSIIVLPKGTNTPIELKEGRIGEDRLLFMRNKWLIAHPQREVLVNKGAYPGIIGENIEVIY